MAKELVLQNGMKAIVDDEDYERVRKYNWMANYDSRGKRYSGARATINNKKVYLHRFVLKAGEKEEIVFKDKNQFNVQKSNLIITKDAGLPMKKAKGQANSSSKYKGVSWYKNNNKWVAKIRVDGRLLHLGYFENEDEAARVYNAEALKYFGEECYQNSIGENNNVINASFDGSVNRTSRKQYNAKTSKYKGVDFNRQKDKWRARICLQGRQLNIGFFDDEIEAAKAYNQEAVKLFGEEAFLNEVIEG